MAEKMRWIKKKRGGERQRLGENKERGVEKRWRKQCMEKTEREGTVWVLAMSQSEKWILE